MSEFSFEKSKIASGITQFALSGKVKTTDVPAFEALFDEALTSGIKNIVLDFKKLDFVNSKGVGIILRTLGALRSSGGEMVVIHVNNQVLQVFKFLTLDKLMKIFPSQEEAIASFGKF